MHTYWWNDTSFILQYEIVNKKDIICFIFFFGLVSHFLGFLDVFPFHNSLFWICKVYFSIYSVLFVVTMYFRELFLTCHVLSRYTTHLFDSWSLFFGLWYNFHGSQLSILNFQQLSIRLPNIFHRLRFSFLVYKSLFIRLPDVFRVLQYSFWVWKISSSVYQIFITICNFLFTISESPPRCTNYLQ